MIVSLPAYFNKYKDPYKAFRFLVMVDGLVVGAFTQFSGIKMEVQTIQARGGSDDRGVQEYVPTLTRFEPVTLTKGVVGSNDFINWLGSIGAMGNSGPSGSLRKLSMDVIALDDKGRWGVIWTLKNAMPVRYELYPMDSSRSEVLSESVTFTIEGMQRQVSPITLLLQVLGV